MAAKRERINPGPGRAQFVRRDDKGQFKEVDMVGRSLKQDRAKKAKTKVKSGQGDRGDRKVSRGSKSASKSASRSKSKSR